MKMIADFSVTDQRPAVTIVWKKIIPILIGLLTYAFLMPFIGFGFSTFLFVLFLIRQIESRSWGIAVLAASGIAASCYLLFQTWLRIQLPTGWS